MASPLIPSLLISPPRDFLRSPLMTLSPASLPGITHLGESRRSVNELTRVTESADSPVTRLRAAHDTGRLADEHARLRRCGLLIVDEVGYILSREVSNLCHDLSQLFAAGCHLTGG